MTQKVRHLRLVDKVQRPAKVVNGNPNNTVEVVENIPLFMTIVSEIDFRRGDLHVLSYRMSYCHPSDTFSKKEGIIQAKKEDNQVVEVFIPDGSSFDEVDVIVLKSILSNADSAPTVHKRFLKKHDIDSLKKSFKSKWA